jgi:NAD(P)-dependent dehydrogenase (short-subunit alcohol dehydrogenase family)
MMNWFITGINAGFGRELTEQLLARGERVAGTVRKTGSVDDLRTMLEKGQKAS